MKYFVMVLISIIMISLFQFAQAREIGPFMFGLDEKEGDWIEYSDSTNTDYYGIVNQGSTINLPLKINAGSVLTQLEFHATIGDQMGPVILPRGIQVEIQPKSFVIEPDQTVTLNLFITAEKNAPLNVYSIGIVGVWPEPINNFKGTSIKVHVGRDFGPNAVPDNFYPSPLKQTREGLLPSEVMCTNNYVLILKNNGNPACVKPTTVQKLIERGWGTITYLDKTMEVQETDHSVKYRIDGNATVTDSVYSQDRQSVIITLDAKTSGSLTIELPRTLIDSENRNCDPYYGREEPFAVLINHEEVLFEEIATTSEKRTLSISFQENAKKIEIVSFCFI